MGTRIHTKLLIAVPLTMAMTLLMSACSTDDESVPAGTTATSVESTSTTAAPEPVTTTTLDEAALADFYEAITTTTTAPPPTTVPAPPPTTAPPVTSPPTTAPPAPAPPAATGGGGVGSFLECVKQRESRGNYQAVNPSSGAGGAYQFLQGTWNNTASHAGRGDLIGVHPSQASPADQDAMAVHLLNWYGPSPWAGPGC
jgi:hypothetical protein